MSAPVLKRISAAHAAQRCDELLALRGVGTASRKAVVDCLIYASLRAIDTHGIALLPTYLNLLDGGRAKAAAVPETPALDMSTARFDAAGALGPVAGQIACDWLVRSARVHGIAAAGVYNSNHFGAAGYYSELLASGVGLGIACCNSDALVVPAGGALPLFGTNPLSIAADAGGGHFFNLDMATSQTSFSRLTRHRQQGTPLEAGWAVDGAGTPTTDPAEAAWLTPLGGYKGQGLAMAVEILSSVLTGADLDHELHHVFDPKPQAMAQGVGHFFIAIDVARFLPRNVFAAQLRRLMGVVAQQSVDEEGNFAFSPGDRERAMLAERSVLGIPVPEHWACFADVPAAA
ncbi:Ldh family oxidoreductase [Massilia rubra]|uniref:Ldh family oxidoreductase n=1 Tax=Massilia rubra TaxID=2607910 RepID=A0ABX0LGF8_9BURK|nr:Ldh family oxidoreductase [Massilia rubra]NHZ33327.1 Ldh family oxidoreductase [Massilia rubra]